MVRFVHMLIDLGVLGVVEYHTVFFMLRDTTIRQIDLASGPLGVGFVIGIVGGVGFDMKPWVLKAPNT